MRQLYLLAAVSALCFAPTAYAADVREPEQEEGVVTEDVVPEPDAQEPLPDWQAGSAAVDEQQPPAASATPVPVPPVTAAEPPSDSGTTDFDTVQLQGLNKVTAKAQPIEAHIGSVTRFGTIEIVAHKCWKSSPVDRPENAVLLEVSEIKQGEAPQRIFSGWMFSSTPGLSSLEHPFYDITVISCGKSAEGKP